MKTSDHYPVSFFEHQDPGSLNSAKVIVPLVTDLVNPTSVLDVGCGTGTWLSVFRDQGVVDIMGVDGSWVNPEKLAIDRSKFISQNLEEPIDMKRKFDLVVSLEVAEHLFPQDAEMFVKSLINHGNTILFSAAIPFQGGINHVNEQWPEYWYRIFVKYGYDVIDPFRKRIWKNPEVNYYYSQNLLLYVERKYLSGQRELLEEQLRTNIDQLSLVHPKKYLRLVNSEAFVDRDLNSYWS